MSNYVEREKHFVLFLINATDKQGKVILSLATENQTRALSEIAFNLLQLPLSKKEKDFLTRKKAVLNKLSKNKLNIAEKKELLHNKRALVLKIVKKFSKILEEIAQ